MSTGNSLEQRIAAGLLRGALIQDRGRSYDVDDVFLDLALQDPDAMEAVRAAAMRVAQSICADTDNPEDLIK